MTVVVSAIVVPGFGAEELRRLGLGGVDGVVNPSIGVEISAVRAIKLSAFSDQLQLHCWQAHCGLSGRLLFVAGR